LVRISAPGVSVTVFSFDHHREVALTHVRYRGKSGKHILVASFSYFDPDRVKTQKMSKNGLSQLSFYTFTLQQECDRREASIIDRHFSITARSFEFSHGLDPKRTTQDRKLMVKEPRTNGGPGSLSCWKGRSTAEPFHYWSLGFGRPRSI
jgi:hypothetical protein